MKKRGWKGTDRKNEGCGERQEGEREAGEDEARVRTAGGADGAGEGEEGRLAGEQQQSRQSTKTTTTTTRLFVARYRPPAWCTWRMRPSYVGWGFNCRSHRTVAALYSTPSSSSSTHGSRCSLLLLPQDSLKPLYSCAPPVVLSRPQCHHRPDDDCSLHFMQAVRSLAISPRVSMLILLHIPNN